MTKMPVILDARVVTGTGGGPDKTILKSPRFLASAGYRNLCAYMHPPDDPGFDQLRQKAAGWGAPLLSVPDRGPWDGRVLTRLLHICRQERVAIWHGHDYKSNLLGLLLRPFWPMRLITTAHGWGVHAGRAPLYHRIDRWCLPFYEKVICVSSDLQEQCVSYGVRPDRCVLIENGIDLDEFSRRTDIAAAKQEVGLPPHRLLIGAVGRLSAEKGFDLLIQATAQLVQKGLDVALVIAGEGEQRPALEALITQSRCADRIRLLGYCADPRPLYEALDVFALSSVREGLPNVLLEAMALEVPVVATRIAGVPRLLRDSENGLLVEPGSVPELARGLERLLRDATLRERLRAAARQTVTTHYCFATRMQKIAAVYDSVLGRERRPTLEPAL
jgi:glycosyltransferase involved in cell wall biosynthesis